MKILAIETSCDETAISILEAEGGLSAPHFSLLSEVVASQLALHTHWGGVVPNLAKREHQRILVPVLTEALQKAGMLKERAPELIPPLGSILEKEPDLLLALEPFLASHEIPDIDAIAVTSEPGLEPALWVGINCAKALAYIWKKPLIPVNHMEGHIYAGMADNAPFTFPALALLVSGGHTELVRINNWREYEILGATKDDAVGEAFDKVARILGLPYPGGPAISKLAELPTDFVLPQPLPRPMISSGDYSFSFSGLKTAVLYMVKNLGELTEAQKIAIAKEFQTAAIDVLLAKSAQALEEHGASMFVIGGGVSANKELRRRAAEMIQKFPDTALSIPSARLSTDNGTMIGVAGYIQYEKDGTTDASEIRANGNDKRKGSVRAGRIDHASA